MALKAFKPNTNGTRNFVAVVNPDLHKGDPERSLTAPLSKKGGRNNNGRVTARHQGGGHKRLYRLVDFKRDNFGVKGMVSRIEYDPNRTAHIALVVFENGDKRYILAPQGLRPGDAVMSGPGSEIRPGNALPLKNIPVGTQIHNVELKPGKGGQLARSAGGSAQLAAREGLYATVRLRSTETRKIHVECRATIGEVGNDEHNLRSYGKAGAKRWRGIRPTGRGVVMNPVDHPHGGGEGKSGQGNPHPVSPWGWNTKGLKTRNNKRTDRFIVKRRQTSPKKS